MNNYLMRAFAPSFTARAAQAFIHTPQGKSYTFSDIYQLSGQIAHALQKAAVKKGDRVAAQVEKCPEAIMLYLACVRIGAVYLPLNTDYTENELSYFINDATPKVFVCRPEKIQLAQRVAQLSEATVFTLAQQSGSLLELALELAAIREDTACDKDDLASILYTSGTTGRSKGAMLSHGNLASNASALAEYWQFSAEDHLIHALPLFHIHGLFVACNVTLIAGCSMCFLSKFNVDAILDHMSEATVLMGVPTFYTRLLASERLNTEIVKNMRLFISGSAPLSSEVHTAFYQRTGHNILERYGMTETNMNASNPYTGERRAGTVGFPLPGVNIRITARDSEDILAVDEIGNIEVKGDNVFQGYWQMPEKTKQEFTQDGFFITGDLGKIDAKGYLHIVGRNKDLIISGGYNVYPKEIEVLIDKIEDVVESAVIGLPHPDFGEGVTAVVVCKQETSVSTQTILSALADNLARYKQPKQIIFVSELPRNVMGKIQKNSLRKQYAALYQEKTVA